MSGFYRKSELVLVGYKGIIGNVIKQEGEFMPTVFHEAKTNHSTKPLRPPNNTGSQLRPARFWPTSSEVLLGALKMYEFIEDRTIGNKVELFARNKRPGWVT